MTTDDGRATVTAVTDDDMRDLQVRWGARLARRREQLQMSQYRLAQLARMDTSHLRRVETGEVNAGDAIRMKLAAALGARVEDIWDYPDGVPT
jgi:transcriptional regulator with XRE-family HTH domain